MTEPLSTSGGRSTGPEAPDIRVLLVETMESGSLELPLLPDTALRAVGACKDDRTGAQGIAELIQRDPTLAGHVLRMANSAAYGASQPIVSLAQAVNRLGSQTLSSIVMATAVKGKVFDVPRYRGLLERLWRHSAAAGAYAREIARLKRKNVEGAFLCGLLHDAGKPVILAAVTDIERKMKRIFAEAEVQALSAEFHARVGGAMVRRWGLPGWMVEALERHHDPAAAVEDKDMVFITSLGNHMAHWALEAEEDGELPAGTAGLGEALDFYPEDMDALKAARNRVKTLSESLA